MSSGVSPCCGFAVPLLTVRDCSTSVGMTEKLRARIRASTLPSNAFEFQIYQKRISKSLIPFHFPGMFGSNDVLSTQVPYRAGAHGLSIWNGLRPGPNARGTTPSTAGRCRSGGGVSIARTGFCGPIGALYSCADAVVTSAARIAIINVFMFFPFVRGVQILARHHACPHYIIRWTTLKRPDAFSI